LNGNLARGRLPGYQSKHLFSGFMKCGKCGGGIAVVSAGRAAGPRYGCRRARREYTCDNTIEMKAATVEERLLAKLQAELQRPEITDYIIRETIRRAQEAPAAGHKRETLAKELEKERKKAPEPGKGPRRWGTFQHHPDGYPEAGGRHQRLGRAAGHHPTCDSA
jgi:hypothetical protein